jgi:small-conductance mechanosensitive channel
LRMVKLGSMAKKTHLNDVFPGSFDVVELLGDLVKWFFIIVFLLQALTVAHLLQVGGLVQGLLNYVPSVVAAAVLVFVGGVVADLTSRIVMNAARAVGAGTARLLGDITRYSVLTLVVFTALAQLGVNTTFLNDLFVSIVAMLALAGGLAFGLGGRDLAKDILESLRSSFRKDV